MKQNRDRVSAGQGLRLCPSMWKATAADVRELSPAPQ